MGATAADAAAAAAAALDPNTAADAAKAAADKVASDKAAADAAANGGTGTGGAGGAGGTAQTPEEKAAADKAAADKKAANDAIAAAALANAPPDKYDLKLPSDSTADKSVVERTAAIARELGLSNERAQKLLERTVQELATSEQSAIEATLQAHAPGGALWEKQVAEWNTAALADELIGGNQPEKLQASVALAKQVLAKYGDKESIEFLEKNPIGSHPALLRLLVRIGKASSEGSLVMVGSQAAPQREAKDDLYPADKQTIKGSPD